jgi:formylglycine-generating enzyme required for sulfatase activity
MGTGCARGRWAYLPWGTFSTLALQYAGERSKHGTTLVGSYSPGGDCPCGAADMVGNVWEWTIPASSRTRTARRLQKEKIVAITTRGMGNGMRRAAAHGITAASSHVCGAGRYAAGFLIAFVGFRLAEALK